MLKKIISFLLIIFIFIAVSQSRVVFAASLDFDPTSATMAVGDTETFDVTIDSTDEQVRGSDIYVLYDSSLLEVTQVTDGDFFPIVQNNITTAGKVYIGAGDDSTGTSKTGTGKIATITFKAKAAGTSNLAYDCTTSSTSETNIYSADTNNTDDIIDCDQNGKATITIGGSSNGGTGTTLTTTPTELPKTGIAETLNTVALPGAMLFILGSAVQLILVKNKYTHR